MEHLTPFEDQLEEITALIVKLGASVEEAIAKSVQGLINRNPELALEVIAGDQAIDDLELEIDSLIMEALARHQPMAKDLRFITTAMKITPDLERIADHAVNISQRALELSEEPPLDALVDIPEMASLAQQMLRRSINAFIAGDADQAIEVIKMDDKIDQRMEQAFRVLLSYMLEDPRTVKRALRLLFVAKYFERIGDQATNICEQVIYMKRAIVVKHKPLPEAQSSDQ